MATPQDVSLDLTTSDRSEIVSSYNTAFGAYACTDLWCVVALRAVDEI